MATTHWSWSLYDAANKKLGKQTLTLNVNNRGDMRMPADGIALAYRFAGGESKSSTSSAPTLSTSMMPKCPPIRLSPQRRSGYSSQGRGQGGGGFAGGGMMGGGGMDGGDAFLVLQALAWLVVKAA